MDKQKDRQADKENARQTGSSPKNDKQTWTN